MALVDHTLTHIWIGLSLIASGLNLGLLIDALDDMIAGRVRHLPPLQLSVLRAYFNRALIRMLTLVALAGAGALGETTPALPDLGAHGVVAREDMLKTCLLFLAVVFIAIGTVLDYRVSHPIALKRRQSS